jgi:hypothetical protein
MPNFIAFRPDAGEFLSSDVSNVLMGAGGYGPRPVLTAAPGAAALAAAPRGAFGGFLPDGTFKGFAATSAEVYSLGATYAWTALSAALSLPADEEQAFAQFGVYMLTSNISDGLQDYNMSTAPATVSNVSGAPAARWMFSANNQMVYLGNTSSNLNRLTVSAFGDHTNTTTKGASKQDMNDGGAFTGGGDLGNGVAVLLQLRAVRKMTFGNAGGGALFRLDKLADDVGCVHPRAQATYNGTTIFLHTDGWWATGGGPPVNIGAGKINKWFLARCSDLKKVWVTVDPKNTLFRIRYAASGDGSTATVFNSILDYNWVTQEFIPGTESTSALFRMGTPGYTLDTISAAFGALDNWSQYPLDSAFWQGGNFRLAGLTSDYKVGFFDGTAAAAYLETPTEGDGRTYLYNWCEPVTDDTAATVTLSVKDSISDQLTPKTAVSIEPSGRAGLRGRGKYGRIKLNHAAAATWTQSSAINGIVKVPGGPR